MFVFPGYGHHHRMPVDARLKSVFDGGTWEKINFPQWPWTRSASATKRNMPTA